jgi:anti-sigma factor (TIGR02949 family)
MDCKLVRTHLDAYVDAELEPTPVIEFERHLDGCPLCRNELTMGRMVQQGLRDLPRPEAPAALRKRVLRSLDSAEAADEASTNRRGAWTAVLSVAAMAALAAGITVQSDSPAGTSGPLLAADAMGLFGDIVARHTDQLPADIPAEPPEQVTNWFRGKVGFRVRSVEFAEPQVHFVGARVSHIRDRQAASFYYTLGGNRLTTVVFEASPTLKRALNDENLLMQSGAHRERIGSRLVTYQNVQGYTVPMVEHDGIVYAFTGDLDQRRLLRLVGSARLP